MEKITIVSVTYESVAIKETLSGCSTRANLIGSYRGKEWNCHFVASCRRDKVTNKRYYFPIRHLRLSLNYRKKGQLAQLVRESDLFFRVKRQIKTVLTIECSGRTHEKPNVRGS